MSDWTQRHTNADNRMIAAFRVAHERRDRGETTRDEWLNEMSEAHDEHLDTLRALWDERRGGTR